MFIIWLSFARSTPAYVCIHSGDSTECDNWPNIDPPPAVTKITDSNFDFVTFDANCQEMYVGVGNVPDLLLSFSDSTFTPNIFPSVFVSNATAINNVVTYDFMLGENNKFQSINFQNVSLKPSQQAIDTKMNHSTGNTNGQIQGFQIDIKNGRLLNGYRFEWNNYFAWTVSMPVGDLYLMDFNEITPHIGSWIPQQKFATFSNFLFKTGEFDARNGENYLNPNYVPLDLHDPLLLGGLFLYTEAYNYFTFELDKDANPTHGFNITSSIGNLYEWKGNWSENITLSHNGVSAYTNQTEIKVVIPEIYNYSIPFSIQQMERKNMSVTVAMTKPMTFESTWDVYDYITIGLENNDQTEIPKIVINRVVFHTPDAFVQYKFDKYEPSNAKKSFAINILEIAPKVKYAFKTKLYGSIWEKLVASPGTNITYNEQKKPLYYSQAVLEFVWDTVIGFPYVQVDVSNFSLDMVFTDNEPIENIENANETYQDIYGVPQKILCGIGLGRVSRRLFTFKSKNPCFQERGVWKVIWSFDGNGSDPDKDPYCLWVNMTEWPFIPPPIIPTPTPDPAAINKNSMIVAIVILIVLIFGAIGGCLTKCIKCGQIKIESSSDSELERELLSTSSSSYSKRSKARSRGKDESGPGDNELKQQDKELDPIITQDDGFSVSMSQQFIDPYKEKVHEENTPLLP